MVRPSFRLVIELGYFPIELPQLNVVTIDKLL